MKKKDEILRALLNLRIKWEVNDDNVETIIDYFRDELIQMYNSVFEKEYDWMSFNEHFDQFCTDMILSINE